MASAGVRPATPHDVDEIVRIQSETWRTAYAELVPAAAIEQLTSDAARQAWADAVGAGEGHHVLVATEGTWTVGFCAAAHYGWPAEAGVAGQGQGQGQGQGDRDQPGGRAVPGSPGPDLPGTDRPGAGAGARVPAGGSAGLAEIGTLLVEPRWGRRGHGGRLLVAVANALRLHGTARGRTWVPEPDLASQRFYARAGWTPDGAVRTLDTGEGTLREVRLSGPLDLTLS